MPYDIVDASRDIETLATQTDFLMRVVQELNKLVVKGEGPDVFEIVRTQMEEEVEPAPKKKTGAKPIKV